MVKEFENLTGLIPVDTQKIFEEEQDLLKAFEEKQQILQQKAFENELNELVTKAMVKNK